MDLGTLTAAVARNDMRWAWEKAYEDRSVPLAPPHPRGWARLIGSLKDRAIALQAARGVLIGRR